MTKTRTSMMPVALAVVCLIQLWSAAESSPSQASHTLAKVGDSITDSHDYLWAAGEGNLHATAYPDLQDVPNHWVGLAHQSVAAIPGATSTTLIDPQYNNDPNCQPSENRVVCEYRLMQPDVALIMIGTNDGPESVANGWFESNLRDILTITQANHIYPILFTIPYNMNWDVGPANAVIRRLATERGVYLIDYYAAMDPLPNHGLSTDGVHPSVPPDGCTACLDADHLGYGYTLRNLLTLQALATLYPDQPPPTARPTPGPRHISKGGMTVNPDRLR